MTAHNEDALKVVQSLHSDMTIGLPATQTLSVRKAEALVLASEV